MAQDNVAVRVYRGSTVESVHRARVAVTDGAGNLLYHLGDPEAPTFLRSSVKPYQLAPLVAGGHADALGLMDEDLAVMASSHSGQEMHVRQVEGILERIGANADDLLCGAHAPFHEPTARALGRAPTTLQNNCSGKHSGMLALASALGAPRADYVHPAHPVQREILRTVSRACGIPETAIAIGTDGCSAPNFAIPLRAGAQLFARLANPRAHFDDKLGEALERIRDAMIRHPHLVAGDDRLDTLVMDQAEGRLLSKAGGEAVQGVADVGTTLGLLLKVEDGAARATAPVLIETLRQLTWLEGRAFEVLGEEWRPTLRNHAGRVVGRIEPEFALEGEARGPLH